MKNFYQTCSFSKKKLVLFEKNYFRIFLHLKKLRLLPGRKFIKESIFKFCNFWFCEKRLISREKIRNKEMLFVACIFCFTKLEILSMNQCSVAPNIRVH